jgi:hypothetical protein
MNVQVKYLLTNPKVAHGMGSKDVDNHEREVIPEGDGKDTRERYFNGKVSEHGAEYER